MNVRIILLLFLVNPIFLYSASNGIAPIVQEKEGISELYDIEKDKKGLKQILSWVKQKILKSVKRIFHLDNASTDNDQYFWWPLSLILIGITFGILAYLVLPPSWGAIGLAGLGFWSFVIGVIMIFKRPNKLEK